MKQLKLLFPVIVFFYLSRMLGSCCNQKYESETAITSVSGIGFLLDDPYSVRRVEMIGANSKTSTKQYPNITLNPGDTVSRYLIFYSSYLQRDSTWVDTVTISYLPRPSHEVGYLCESNYNEEIIMTYENVRVSATTFTNAEVQLLKDRQPVIKITH